MYDNFVYRDMSKIIFEPTKLGPLTLKNRLIKSATYEGRCSNNSVSNDLINWHTRIAKGGVAMTTLAYCAISEDGITLPEQIYIRNEILPDLKRFTDAIHKENTAASIQLTHCGFFTKNRTIKGKKPISPSKTLNKYGIFSGLVFSRTITANDLLELKESYKKAASISVQASFDALEIHMGHGYLLSQFLSPITNRRSDGYGGSFENRIRFPIEVIRSVIDSIKGKIPVLVKLNLDDGVKGGFSIEDCIGLTKILEAEGVSAIELTGGFTSINAFYLLRGGRPLWSMIKNEKNHLQKIVMALFGPMVVRKYPFYELYFRELALRVREEVNLPLIYVGGAFSKESIDQILLDGFDLVAMGRPLIHDPEFPNLVKLGKVEKSGCNACNECVGMVGTAPIECVLNS